MNTGYPLRKFAPFIRKVVSITAFRIHLEDIEIVRLPVAFWTVFFRIAIMTRTETGVASGRAQASDFDSSNDVEVLGIIAAGGGSKFVLDIDIPAFDGNTVEDLDEALERLGGDGRGRRPQGRGKRVAGGGSRGRRLTQDGGRGEREEEVFSEGNHGEGGCCGVIWGRCQWSKIVMDK